MASKSGTRCAFLNCSSKTGKGISLFSFPNNRQKVELWLRACDREELLDKSSEVLSKYYKLCEKHFEESCFVGKGKKRKHLAGDSIPTLFTHPDDEETKKKVLTLSAFEIKKDVSEIKKEVSDVTEVFEIKKEFSDTTEVYEVKKEISEIMEVSEIKKEIEEF